jgi:NADPH:quinone reductase-like Zn-dependent oxidoreductase
MKAYELQPREGFDSLTIVDRAPQELGPTDVRVRVRAVSLNFRDLNIARAARKRSRAVVPVSDGAGEVIEVGARVTRREVGERVAAAFFPTWLDGELAESHHANALGGSIDGMLRETVVLGEQAWVPIPEHLTFEEAATLPCAGVTAWHALFEAGGLRPGETVLVQGTGGVSIFALPLARAAGARVVLTSSSDRKRERARELGAEHTIDYRTTPAWGEAARGWTGGRGVDLGVEVGGPGTFDQTIAALRYGGTMSILGVLTGMKGEINTYAIFHKAARIRGVYVGSVRMFEAMNRALAISGLRPIIDSVFPFDRAREAYDHLASGAHFGKVVIRID